jgi:hypothetical protein
MRGMELKNFVAVYKSILNESVRASYYKKFADVKLVSRKTPTVDEIKEKLLEITGLQDWQAFLDEERPGDCDMIARAVSRMYPKVKMVSVRILFSEQAKAKMDPQDDPMMYTCTHFLNKLDNRYIDFGKATNIYEDVYVLDGVDDITSCEYSDEAVKMLTDEREEDPRQIGTYLR